MAMDLDDALGLTGRSLGKLEEMSKILDKEYERLRKRLDTLRERRDQLDE